MRPGEIVSVIGPNGAGKSTTFKTVVGFLRPRAGRVVFNGEDITGLRTDASTSAVECFAELHGGRGAHNRA